LAWLMQIAMFLVLGLLVFPSQLIPVIGEGLLMSAFLVFVARPVAVFASLAFTRYDWRAKVMVAWAGLRGAAAPEYYVYLEKDLASGKPPYLSRLGEETGAGAPIVFPDPPRKGLWKVYVRPAQ
ncbi:MAG: cation:proton antiporter, partial [Planctomycetota bacterium]